MRRSELKDLENINFVLEIMKNILFETIDRITVKIADGRESCLEEDLGVCEADHDKQLSFRWWRRGAVYRSIYSEKVKEQASELGFINSNGVVLYDFGACYYCGFVNKDLRVPQKEYLNRYESELEAQSFDTPSEVEYMEEGLDTSSGSKEEVSNCSGAGDHRKSLFFRLLKKGSVYRSPYSKEVRMDLIKRGFLDDENIVLSSFAVCFYCGYIRDEEDFLLSIEKSLGNCKSKKSSVYTTGYEYSRGNVEKDVDSKQ